MGVRLGLADLGDLLVRAIPIYRQERLGARDPLASAIDLFLLQGSIPGAELESLFGPGDQAALTRAGILEGRGGAVRALVSLYPVGTDLIFSDHACPQLEPEGGPTVPHDQVMYVGTDSRWLARATVRKPIPSALDLCCGSGVQALLAAAHATRVTAVDINPRAVRCTAFNAKAAGIQNLEALQGDLYGPVGSRCFDLITANPPFVPAPEQEVGYRDGGPSGEDVLGRIIEGLPRHLARGGMAQIVTEIGEREGESLEPRIRQWLGDAPMDVHVARLRFNPIQTYAIGHAHGEDHASFLHSVGRWAANLRTHAYSGVASVLMAFQWSEAPWYRLDEAHPPTRGAGPELEGLFAAERLARNPALRDRLQFGTVGRVGPVALSEHQVVGAPVPPVLQAHLLGQAMTIDHSLDRLQLDLLKGLDRPLATQDLLGAAAEASVPGEAVLDALVSLLRKGFLQQVS